MIQAGSEPSRERMNQAEHDSFWMIFFFFGINLRADCQWFVNAHISASQACCEPGTIVVGDGVKVGLMTVREVNWIH